MIAHIHRDLIVAWANGSKIEVFGAGRWVDCTHPMWSVDSEYRIKKADKIDVVCAKLAISHDYDCGHHVGDSLKVYSENHGTTANIKCTFINDKLTAVEVI